MSSNFSLHHFKQTQYLNSRFLVLSAFVLKKQLFNFSRKLLENCMFYVFKGDHELKIHLLNWCMIFPRHSDITISWLDKCRSYFKWIFHGKRTKTTHFCKICITKEEETSFKFLRRKFFVGHYVPSCFVLPFNTIHTKTCMIILIMHCRHTTSICLGTPSCFV